MLFIDHITQALLGKNYHLHGKAHHARSKRKLGKVVAIKDGSYQFGDIRMPLPREGDAVSALPDFILEETFSSYLFSNDSYDEKTVDYYDNILGDGLCGLQNDQVNVTVEPGDIVIDAGSYVGDFAAYASVKGATTYAFEPEGENFEYLLQTAQLNPNIIPVKKGLSDQKGSETFFVDGESSTFLEERANAGAPSETIETTTLDDFVREQGLERVDFIKADIEGFERRMLAGAQETLRRFAPKLALCTYHLPDDPEVMAALIKQANPAYNIVQKRHKLYASVPKPSAL